MLVNNGDFIPGCIYRIALENFVTYTNVELFPGKSLNLIIGPNGTGKSTFVCAIVLGLCGKPIDLGKNTQISTFIKEGYKCASIEIELYDVKGTKNMIIKRIIKKSNSPSEWYINNKKVCEKMVKEKIKELNIQVDNLCQLLPQDKVQEFSALKPKELLKCTLTALGRQESIKQWDQLINKKNDLLDVSKNLELDQKNLEKLKRDNKSLKQKIEIHKLREKTQREIDICEKKQLWLESQALKVKLAKCLEEHNQAKETVDIHKTQMKFLENDLECSKKHVRQLESQELKSNQEMLNLKDQLRKCINSFETYENEIKRIEPSYMEKLNIQKKKEDEIIHAKIRLDKLIMDEKAMGNMQDENNLNLEEIRKEKQSVTASIDNLNKNLTKRTYSLENEIRSYKNQIQKIEDIQTKRLEILNVHNKDTYKALIWLRANRDKFKHPVYEPMMLEINFTDPIYARYLEWTVSSKDLIAFTFECKNDMNRFNSIVRNELDLKLVNAVHSAGGDFNIQSRNLRDLSCFGFNICLYNTLRAPAAILRYLCKMYNIHKIPIGNEHTYRNSEKVPKDIRLFFSEKHKHVNKLSAYGTQSSTTIEINDPYLFANTTVLSTDGQTIISVRNKLEKCQHKKIEIENETTAELSNLENKLGELDLKINKKTEFLDKIQLIKRQINSQKNFLNSLKNAPKINEEQEEALCKEQYKKYVIKQCNVNSDIFNIMNNIHNKVLTKMKICMIQIEAGRDEILEKDANVRRCKGELEAKITKLNTSSNNLKDISIKAKDKEVKMMKALDWKPPTDLTSPYFKEFNNLPTDRIDLNEYKVERLTRISCMENVDSQTLEDYEKLNKEIERITHSLNKSNNTTTELTDSINSLKSEWLPPLESLLTELSSKFSQMFGTSVRAGEIKLYKAKGDDDFDGYGIHVMVKFRPDELLAPMTRHVQSGGERALTTATYLLALQAATAAPFRCVDEINQGMDDVNEKLMMELMIRETTRSDSQYFILSPKLLLGMEYNEKVTIHTVMNGKHIINYEEWNNNEFLARARSILH